MQLLHSFHLVIINCWLSKRLSIRKIMLIVIKNGINPILNQYDYAELSIKIGIDEGENLIVQYRHDKKFSNWCSWVLHEDICKITSLDDYNRITIGDDVYTVFLDTWKWYLKKLNIVLKIVNILIENGQIYKLYSLQHLL